MMKRVGILATLSVIVAVAAHAQSTGGSTSSPKRGWKFGVASPMPLTKGEVERVDKEHGEVVLKHGDLPNLGMPAMTMAFGVADRRMLERLKEGDKVRFNAEIVKGEATITYIESAR
jgi:Cu/Ag efflux protein CusF